MSLSLSQVVANAAADAANVRPGVTNAVSGAAAVGAAPRRKPRLLPRIVSGALLLLALSLGGALGGCSSDPPPVIITSVGTASQHYVHIEVISFNSGQWGAPGGSTHGGYGPPARWGGGAHMGSYPVPTRVFVRWFDYPKQRFYEADLDLPDLPATAAEAVGKRDPRFFYQNTLIVAVGAQGEVMLWLDGYTGDYAAGEDPNWEKLQFTIDLIGSGQARYASGNPRIYKEATADARAKGEIPQEPVPSDDKQ